MDWEKIGTEPSDGTEFLAYRKGIISQCGWKPDKSGLMLGGQGWSYPEWDMPTHWMPLPTPPQT